jgi:hypothetical protein
VSVRDSPPTKLFVIAMPDVSQEEGGKTMLHHKSVLMAGAIAIAALLSGASSQAWQPLTRPNHLTFSAPVAVPGAVLAPGAYTFELSAPGTSMDIVRVSSRDGRLIYYTGFTRRVSRPRNLPAGATVTFGEAAKGEPTPVAVWYPIDSADGHEFIYR